MTEKTYRLEVLRYRPETDSEPQWQSFDVPANDQFSVLNALNYIKDRLDSSLSFRWSCQMAVCGSCGMMVNGQPSLACKTFLRELSEPIRVEALAHFAIVRDLVVDIEPFLRSLERVKPYLIPAEQKSLEDGTYLQTPGQLAKFKQYSMCINCLLCYAACPQFGLEPEFTGPAALALGLRYNLDSRDAAARERIRAINTEDGVWPCMFVGTCSDVCPKHVNPASAVQQTKIRATLGYFRDLIASDNKQGGGQS